MSVRKKYCIACNRLQSIDKEHWDSLDHMGPYACSPDCLVAWVRLQQGNTRRLKELVDCEIALINDRNRPFRSGFEQRVTDTLTRMKVQWWFEPYTFKLYEARDTTWTPDLYLSDFGTFVEVKGKWTIGAKKKLERFRRRFCFPTIVVPWGTQELYEFSRPDLRLE